MLVVSTGGGEGGRFMPCDRGCFGGVVGFGFGREVERTDRVGLALEDAGGAVGRQRRDGRAGGDRAVALDQREQGLAVVFACGGVVQYGWAPAGREGGQDGIGSVGADGIGFIAG